MKLEISVMEVVNIFKEINEQPEQLYEMIRADIERDNWPISFRADGCGAYAFSGQKALWAPSERCKSSDKYSQPFNDFQKAGRAARYQLARSAMLIMN